MKKIVLVDTTPDIAVAFACVATCHHGEVLVTTSKRERKIIQGPVVLYSTVLYVKQKDRTGSRSRNVRNFLKLHY